MESPERPFFGRKKILQGIIDRLMSPQARARKEASLLVEGPSGRGKTRLLEQAQILLQEHAQRPIICAYPVSLYLAGSSPDWYRFVARLCIQAHPAVSGSPWPFDQLDLTMDEAALAEKLREQEFTIISLVRALADAITTIDRLLILVVDGIEETDLALLKTFEQEIVEPLFRPANARLLASRRVDSQQHTWSRFLVRGQTKAIALDGFDGPDERADQPELAQIELLMAQHDVTLDLIAQTRDQILSSLDGYSWGNPRANELLVRPACQRDPARITRADILAALNRLIQPPRPLPAPGADLPGEWDNETIMELIDQLRAAPTIGEGISRHELTELLRMEDDRRDLFLGHLQDRGVGYFRKDGAFVIYPEFVSLLRALEYAPHD